MNHHHKLWVMFVIMVLCNGCIIQGCGCSSNASQVVVAHLDMTENVTFEVPRSALLSILPRSEFPAEVELFESTVREVIRTKNGLVYLQLHGEADKSFVGSVWKGNSCLKKVGISEQISLAAVPSGRQGEYLILVSTSSEMNSPVITSTIDPQSRIINLHDLNQGNPSSANPQAANPPAAQTNPPAANPQAAP